MITTRNDFILPINTRFYFHEADQESLCHDQEKTNNNLNNTEKGGDFYSGTEVDTVKVQVSIETEEATKDWHYAGAGYED